MVRVLTNPRRAGWRVACVAPAAPWTFAPRRSFGPSSRNTSPPRRRSAAHALVERYRLGVSSATVRAVLAELEAAGLLTHPHTSAGRVPTEHGYRYYVESIVDSVPLPPVEQLMIRHQFGQVEYASEHWFRLAATTLASVTRAAGLATPAKPSSAHLRRLDLVIDQRPARQPDPRPARGRAQAGADHASTSPSDQEELSAVANRLNELLDGLTADRGRGGPGRARRGRPGDGPAAPRRRARRPRAAASSTAPRSRSCSATACST